MIELHFRYSLGLVTYHVAGQYAPHESHLRELGVRDQCQYPGFSDDAVSPFRGLAHDLSFAEDFLSGLAEVLRRAAEKQAVETANLSKADIARHVGDVRQIEQMRERFREGKYREVVSLASRLKYPNRMTESQRRIVEIAREKSSYLRKIFRWGRQDR